MVGVVQVYLSLRGLVGSLFTAGLRETWVSGSGPLLVTDNHVSPTLFLPLNDFDFKGNFAPVWELIFLLELHVDREFQQLL